MLSMQIVEIYAVFWPYNYELGVTVGRIAPTSDDSGFITAEEAEKLLGVLCEKYGFCLPQLWHARLRFCPPKSVAKFTDTVFHAEGLDPATADRAMYRA